jgi:anti-sigma regulatory factor (Ser/Thr protein kinase)
MIIFEVDSYDTLHTAIARLCEFLISEQVAEQRVFDSRLAVSELLGNVLRHSGGKARLHGEVKDGFVELCLYASVQFIPPEESRCPDVFSENGRGLFLVDSVCVERTFTEDGAIRLRIKSE